MDEDNKQARQWVATWKRAGAALDEVRRQELMSFSYDENFALIDSMLQWACDNATPRVSTGLVEQQRLFQLLRARSKKNQKS